MMYKKGPAMKWRSKPSSHKIKRIIPIIRSSLNILTSFYLQLISGSLTTSLEILHLQTWLACETVYSAIPIKAGDALRSLVYLGTFSILTAGISFTCPIQVILPSEASEYTSFKTRETPVSVLLTLKLEHK